MSTIDLSSPDAVNQPPPEPRVLEPNRSLADKIYRAVATAGGLSVFLILGLMAFFLITQSIDPLRNIGWRFFTNFDWVSPLDASNTTVGVGAVMYGTVVSSVMALVLALPVGVGTALYINEYAPLRVRKILTTLIDLLAAVPSIIFGFWGLYELQPRLQGMQRWLADYLGWIPLFRNDFGIFGNSLFMLGLILAIMIVPIISSVSREVMAQTPVINKEAALGLGGTRWGMIKTVVLPHARSGIIGAAMLGLGRAMGETMVAAIILSPRYEISAQILQPGGGTVAGLIANQFNEASVYERSALIAAGLALFVLTFIVNMAARYVVNRATAVKGLDL